ncbi:hypothetical protein RKE29_02335 [Streptomyces sp. B1866]|uniref:hypothetical protein n=1 Tax=Streptomyces sp. B1866 TaxID=3075431 RepID=UPI00288EBD57|nr:hypothetical protein [Streptomyces sp. B1866]MDT3395495.1 hypothetical protein [Streptomyces sp. B1866]
MSITNRPGTVPYITAWSRERHVDAGVVRLPWGIAYRDEVPQDRLDGVLWSRLSILPKDMRGRPEFGRVHARRQCRAMRKLLCQVCGGPADRTEQGVLWLLKDDLDPNDPSWQENLRTTHPPVCLPCAKKATLQCPHLRRDFVTLRVRDPQPYGVYGVLYPPGGPATDATVAYDDHAIRWVRAAQAVVTLRKWVFVDLEAERDARSDR